MPAATSSPSIVITGAAGALGRAVAQHLHDSGARLALIDQSAERLSEAFPELDHARHVLIGGDVESSSSMRVAAESIVLGLGEIDALVHIAGGFEAGEAVHALSRSSWDRMMNLNAWSFVVVAQSLLPAMMKQRSGRVVAVSAKSAGRGVAEMAAYIASKSALQRLVEAMAAELAPHGIGVNSVAPNVLDTPANRLAMPNANPAAWVSTTTAAQVIGFLVSPAAAGVNGQHLVLDA